MSVKKKVGIIACLAFLFLYSTGEFFIGSEQRAREIAITMFNEFATKFKLPKDLFDGPAQRPKSIKGYSYAWTLKPHNNNFPPVQIFAFVYGGFNSDIGPTTEALLFFKAQCESDKAVLGKNSSMFKGFCT